MAEEIGSKYAKSFRVHLKIETGTSRQGILLKHLPNVLTEMQRMKHVQIEGVSTHFANIEDTSNPEYATLQFTRFQDAVQTILDSGFKPSSIHCACSAAILLYPQTHGTLVRGGISLYGIWSSDLVQHTLRSTNVSIDLQPALSWKTRVGQIKELPSGTPIGYGLTHILNRQSRIAVIPVGYWDGYDRLLSSKGEVIIRGTRCRVVGRICMNMMMVDVSSVPDIQKGDEVLLLGTSGRHTISADSIAALTQTIPYEVVTRINPLLPRVVV